MRESRGGGEAIVRSRIETKSLTNQNGGLAMCYIHTWCERGMERLTDRCGRPATQNFPRQRETAGEIHAPGLGLRAVAFDSSSPERASTVCCDVREDDGQTYSRHPFVSSYPSPVTLKNFGTRYMVTRSLCVSVDLDHSSACAALLCTTSALRRAGRRRTIDGCITLYNISCLTRSASPNVSGSGS